MHVIHSVLAAALGAFAIGAQAQSSIWYSANVGDEVSGNMADVGSASLPAGTFSSGGLVGVQAGPASASLSVLADPVTGMYKSFSRAQVNAGSAVGSASAGSSFTMRDTLTFNGPDATVDVTFDFHWDTIARGIDAAASQRQGDGAAFVPTWMFSSSQSLRFGSGSTSGGGDPCRGEPFCEMGGGLLPEPPRPVNEVWGWAFGGPSETQFYGVGDGRYSGGLTKTFTVASGTSIDFQYTAANSVQCFATSLCDLSLDATHSDYIGMTVSPGASFASANGYRYLGIAGMAAPVPEPATGALALLGLAAVVARRRREQGRD